MKYSCNRVILKKLHLVQTFKLKFIRQFNKFVKQLLLLTGLLCSSCFPLTTHHNLILPEIYVFFALWLCACSQGIIYHNDTEILWFTVRDLESELKTLRCVTSNGWSMLSAIRVVPQTVQHPNQGNVTKNIWRKKTKKIQNIYTSLAICCVQFSE